METQATLKLFYEFEGNQTIRQDIQNWCTHYEELDFATRWRIISMMNGMLGINGQITRINLFNYKKDKVLIAQRSGARVMETGNGLDAWAGMLNLKQTNLMYTSMGEKF